MITGIIASLQSSASYAVPEKSGQQEVGCRRRNSDAEIRRAAPIPAIISFPAIFFASQLADNCAKDSRNDKRSLRVLPDAIQNVLVCDTNGDGETFSEVSLSL